MVTVTEYWIQGGSGLNKYIGCFATSIAGHDHNNIYVIIDADDDEVAQAISVIFFYNMLAALIFPQLGHFVINILLPNTSLRVPVIRTFLSSSSRASMVLGT